MPLTTHQEEAKNSIIQLIKDNHKRILLLGSAGTGKTYLSSELVKLFKQDRTINTSYNNGLVYVTAPTHKALSVLKSKMKDIKVEFTTIHSALDIKLGYPDRKTGIRQFKRVPSIYNPFPKCKICIIDECSMVESKLIDILDDTDTFNFPIIFLGDSKQLSPIGEDISPIFTKNYPIVELKEIIRQGAGNPIIDLSNDIDLIYFKQPKIINNTGYIYSNNKTQIIEDLSEVNGSDELKYLAFTNQEVDNINKLVRENIYKDPMKVEKGESIVFNSPYGKYYTNQEVKVVSLEIITDFLRIPTKDTKVDKGSYTGRTDKLKFKYYEINNSIKIIHEDSEYLYNTIKKELFSACKTSQWDWQSAYLFAEQFADFKYNHAISVHKSQGSTYHTSIINIKDIHFAKEHEQLQKLLYTAITRASNLVILYNVQ